MKERWWDWPAAAFLILVLFCSASRLQTTNWTEYLGRIQILVLASTALGLALGYSVFSARVSFLFGTVFSLAIPIWSLAALVLSDTWLERVSSVFGRLGLAVAQLFSNQPVRDPILFLTLMVFLFWITGIVGGYRLVRKGSPWWALVAPGVIILVVEVSFDMFVDVPDQGSVFSFLFLLFLVLLIARIYYIGSRKSWISQGHMVENEVGFDLGRGAAIAGLALMLLAWYSPQLVKALSPGTNEQRSLSTDIQRFRERFDKAVSSLRSSAPMTVESLGDTLGLGSGNKLGTDIIMYVTPGSGRLTQGRYYWTGRDYDTYLNDQWQVTLDQLQAMGPDESPVSYKWNGRTVVSVDILSRISFLRTLFYPNALISVSRSAKGVVGPTDREEADINALFVDPPLRAGESYHIVASVSIPSVQMLQSSNGPSYPDWVKNRYLQLPEKFSARIKDLAKAVSEPGKTQYEKVSLITTFLRENYQYEPVLTVSPPPAVDPIEWFLFVHKAGFCNYYATSEVLMLRSLGIPARLAIGYAEGAWSDTEKRFVVMAKDYHAWPEVYFNNLGWVPFEPTAGQPILEYPVNETPLGASGGAPVLLATPFVPPTGGADRADRLNTQDTRSPYLVLFYRYGPLAGILLGALLLAYGLYRLLEKPIRSKKPLPVYLEDALKSRGWRVPVWLRGWARLERRSPMEKLFASVGQMMRTWGTPPLTEQTPSEQVDTLIALLPEVSSQARVLLEEYHHAAYSPHQFDYARARQAVGDLRVTGYRTWLSRRTNRKMG